MDTPGIYFFFIVKLFLTPKCMQCTFRQLQFLMQRNSEKENYFTSKELGKNERNKNKIIIHLPP